MDSLADTSFILATINRNDLHHAIASRYFAAAPGDFLLPSVAVTEVAYHIARWKTGKSVPETLRLIQIKPIKIIDPLAIDYTRAFDILDKYHDTRIDFVDACLMALSDRLGIRRVLTFDRRDFGLYRTPAGQSLELLP
jgi:predicted nucleic acid-binding protein